MSSNIWRQSEWKFLSAADSRQKIVSILAINNWGILPSLPPVIKEEWQLVDSFVCSIDCTKKICSLKMRKYTKAFGALNYSHVHIAKAALKRLRANSTRQWMPLADVSLGHQNCVNIRSDQTSSGLQLLTGFHFRWQISLHVWWGNRTWLLQWETRAGKKTVQRPHTENCCGCLAPGLWELAKLTKANQNTDKWGTVGYEPQED